jgi:hypothetical protein
MAPPPVQDASNDAPDAEAADENPPDDGDQNAAVEVEQPGVQDPSGARTPQQMLQEMQQRQLQMQQQLAPGQPPIPGAGMPGGLPGMPQRPPQQEP